MKKIKRFKRINWIAVIIAILVTGLAWLAWGYLQPRTNQAQTLRLLQQEEAELNSKLTELKTSKANAQDLEKAKHDLIQQQQVLEQQLQSKRAAVAADKVYAAALDYNQQQIATAGCYGPKSCIYFHESHNNPRAINPLSGACGLGQSLPCAKLPCSLTDYACQDNWFTAYAYARYGGWTQAWTYWQVHQNW